MKRFLLALAMMACAAVLVAAPASAQTDGYGGGTPPSTSAPPSGCPVEDPPSEDSPPCHPREQASVSDPTVTPGQSITVSTPPVFAPGSEVTVNLVRAARGSTPAVSQSSTTNSTGATSEGITIPDVDSGIYFIYVVGQDADGNRIVAIVPIVVRAGSTAAAVQGDSFQSASAAPVPAAVAEVQTDLPGDTEAAIVDAVAAGDAGLLLSPEGTLNVRTPQGTTQAASALPTTGNDISGYVTAGGALILAGTGLVLMRRRKEARL